MEREVRRYGAGDLGEHLRERRHELGLSQEDLVIALETVGVQVGRATISRVENGQVLPDLRLLAGLCRVLALDAGRLLERVLSLPGTPGRAASGEPPRRLLREAEDLVRSGAYRAARLRFEAALDRLGCPEDTTAVRDSRMRPRLHLSAAWCLLQDLAFQAAFEHAARALNDPAANAAERLRALACMARCAASLGREEEATILAREAEERLRAAGGDHPSLAGFVQGMLAEAAKVAGRDDEAARRFLEAARAWTRAAVPEEVARARCARAGCLARAGLSEEAGREAAEALATARELAPSVLPDALVAMARVELGRGREEAALHLSREASAMARELGRDRVEFLALFTAWQAGGEGRDRSSAARLEHLALRLAAHLEEAREWLASRSAGPTAEDRR